MVRFFFFFCRNFSGGFGRLLIGKIDKTDTETDTEHFSIGSSAKPAELSSFFEWFGVHMSLSCGLFVLRGSGYEDEDASDDDGDLF